MIAPPNCPFGASLGLDYCSSFHGCPSPVQVRDPSAGAPPTPSWPPSSPESLWREGSPARRGRCCIASAAPPSSPERSAKTGTGWKLTARAVLSGS